MKSKFAKSWNSSTQPRKQRKFRANAPHHIRGSFISGHLSPALRKKYGTRSARIRKGDRVKIMKGSFKGKEGEVQLINVKKHKVYVAGLELARKDGSKVQVPIRPSNIMILELEKSDKRRIEKLGNLNEKKESIPVEKPVSQKSTPEKVKQVKSDLKGEKK